MTSDKMLTAALWYTEKAELGIIPVKAGGKTPCLMSWKEYQDRKPTLDEINRWWGHSYPGANIGIVTGKINNLTVIDIDTPEAKVEIEKHLPDTLQTPTVKTPKGQHLYFTHQPEISNKANLFPGCDARNDGGYVVAPPSRNGTGDAYSFLLHLKNTALMVLPSTLFSYLLSLSNNNIYARAREDGNDQSPIVTNSNIIFNQGGRDETLFHLANHLVKSGMPQQEIQQYLTFIANHCDPPYPLKDIEKKIKSALGRSDVRSKSIAQEVREFIEVTSGNFRVTDVERMVTTVTKSNKGILMELSRLVRDEEIERIDKSPGMYRKIETTFKVVDLMAVSEDELDIRLPFGMEKYIEILPKDLIVFAGVPNAGKTALMLEVVRLNMARYDIWYFSSEMGAANCKKRLKKHESMGIDEWKFNFIDDFPNYTDVIQPNGFNIIDYVEEVSGEAYRIPGILASIQKRLDKGIAVVALQKNPDKDYAIGGQQTKAKPALFCAVDPDFPGAKIRIVKAKNYRDENPNGFIMKFKIVNGIKLLPDGVWEPEV